MHLLQAQAGAIADPYVLDPPGARAHGRYELRPRRHAGTGAWLAPMVPSPFLNPPIAHRSASTRFDLPQPFGPTTPVRPGSIMKSVGSTKDLKPWRRRRVSFIGTILCWPGANLPAVTIP